MVFFFYRVNNYFPLLASRMYFSKAIVIEGAFGDGAKISILKPLSKASFCGASKRLFWFVLFKLRKFLNNDLIPVGLKRLVYHNTRPLDQKDRSLLFCKTAGVNLLLIHLVLL
jgi:hypothetical protein